MDKGYYIVFRPIGSRPEAEYDRWCSERSEPGVVSMQMVWVYTPDEMFCFNGRWTLTTATRYRMITITKMPGAEEPDLDTLTTMFKLTFGDAIIEDTFVDVR